MKKEKAYVPNAFLINWWVERLPGGDPRREAFERWGWVVRRPCVARLLTYGLVVPDEWLVSVAVFMYSALLIDLPMGDAADLTRKWNAGLPIPLPPKVLEPELARPPLKNVGCEWLKTAAWLPDIPACLEDCTFLADYTTWERTGPDALAIAGHLYFLPPMAVKLYGGLWLMEREWGRNPGDVLHVPQTAAQAFCGVTPASFPAARDSLKGAGLIEQLSPGAAAKRKAAKFRRVVPVPLRLPREHALASRSSEGT